MRVLLHDDVAHVVLTNHEHAVARRALCGRIFWKSESARLSWFRIHADTMGDDIEGEECSVVEGVVSCMDCLIQDQHRRRW